MSNLRDIILSESSDTPVTLEIENEGASVTAKEGISGACFLQIPADSSGDIVINVNVEQGASLQVVCICSANVSITQQVHIEQEGTASVCNITLASAVQHELDAYLNGQHAISNVDWMFYAARSDQQKLTAKNHFLARSGGGEMNLKGVAENDATVSCNGMIDIGPDGGQTDTYLTEDVLMLDSTAKVDATPGLEIKTNDVKASHSATVSKVTSADLFYFAARGIDEQTARNMYVRGFLEDLCQKIADTNVRETVINAIEQKYAAVN